MFQRKERFPRALFPAALKTGRRLSSTHLTIVIPKEGRGYAVVMSKKVARLAVTRNRVRRRILAALRTTPLPPALIVFPRSSVSSVSYQDIKTELIKLIP